MTKATKWLFYFFLITFAFPTGSVFGFPIKTVLSLMLVLFFVCTGKIKIDKYTIGFAGIVILLCGWSLLSIHNGYTTYLSFIKSYVSLLLVVWISYQLCSSKIVDTKQVFKLMTIVIYCKMIFRCLASFSCTFGLSDFEFVQNSYIAIFNSESVSMTYTMGNLNIYRIQYASDNVPYVWLSFYLLTKQKDMKKLIAIALTGLFTMIVYSRVIMVQYILIVVIYLFIYLKENIDRHFLKCMIIVLLMALFLIVMNLRTNVLEGILFRFFSSETSESDRIRSEQSYYLWQGIKDNPFIGHGTGSFVNNYIRSNTLLYSYEKEYLSFVYQFGFVGFALIICTTIFLFCRVDFKEIKNKTILFMVLFNFAIWLIKPLYNPSFLSSNSGIVIACIYMFGHCLQKEKRDEKIRKTVAAISSGLISC